MSGTIVSREVPGCPAVPPLWIVRQPRLFSSQDKMEIGLA
jgi:hypothetical protein